MQAEVSKGWLGSRSTKRDVIDSSSILGSEGFPLRTSPTLLCREDARQSTAVGPALAFCVLPSLERILQQDWEEKKTPVRKARHGKIPPYV